MEVQRADRRRRFSIIAPREGQAFPREIPAGVSDGALAAGTEEKLVHKDGMIFDALGDLAILTFKKQTNDPFYQTN